VKNNNYCVENQALKMRALSVFWLQRDNSNSVETNIFNLQNTSEERK
jgi:hypothetical protein